MRKYAVLFIALFILVQANSAFAQKAAVPAPVEVDRLPTGTKTRPVQLSKIVVKLNRGEPFGRLKGGLICVVGEPLVWKGGRSQLDTEDFDEVFKEELGKLGYDVVGVASDLFDEGDDKRAEYLIGGTIRSMSVDVCFPNSGFGDLMTAKGTAMMAVEWQIYNRLDRTVVDTFTSRTGFVQKKSQSGGLETIVFSAFAENVRALAASGKLQKALVGAAADLSVARRPGAVEPILLRLPAGGVGHISDAVGATVLIQSGSGHGSGFLIADDGYFLTNYHVVGSATYVKLRWSDGIESLGEVVRVDRGRDIALIKGDARGRKPIRLRPSTIGVGSNVLAIGAPLDRVLQNTVTRGIVSSHRVLDGYSYLQSDTSVAPGDSGGPLIDDQSDLVAVTVSGVRINGAPQGLNFFIPAQEALDFLGIVRTP